MTDKKLLPTRSEVEKYLGGLDCGSCLVDIYRDLDAIRFSVDDTLSDEFQIASEMVDIIYKYSERHISISKDFHIV